MKYLRDSTRGDEKIYHYSSEEFGFLPKSYRLVASYQDGRGHCVGYDVALPANIALPGGEIGRQNVPERTKNRRK